MALAPSNKLTTDLLAVRNGFKTLDELDAVSQGLVFDHFCNNGEMPYGTAKARDGDPTEWIEARLAAMTDVEFDACQMEV